MPPATNTMRLDVNGESRDVPHGTTIAELVEQLGLAKSACAVEVNRELAPKASHTQHTLADGDVVEIVTLVGGG